MDFLIDRKFRKPRLWSNIQLKKFAGKFSGKVVNVSGWNDFDKDNNCYRNYFKNCHEYYVSNWKTDAKGFQGNLDNEFFLDLESNIKKNLQRKFDVVFNHTCLEHIYDFKKAFANLCLMSRGVVIVVVPFLQEQHFTRYFNDYWRFTPQSIKKMFEQNNFDLSFINFNNNYNESIYIFAIGVKKNKKIRWLADMNNNKIKVIDKIKIGKKSVTNNFFYKLFKL